MYVEFLLIATASPASADCEYVMSTLSHVSASIHTYCTCIHISDGICF